MSQSNQNLTPLKVAIVGTGIFAKKAHLPALVSSAQFEPYSCFNRTKAKAEDFAQLTEEKLKVYDSLDEVFADSQVDLVDALLPAQFNLDIVKRAVAAKKNIVIEKPIAANLEQAKEIVKIAQENKDIIIAVNEHWCYLKAVTEIKNCIKKIGKVVGFNYHSTGAFNFNNEYLTTSWRQNPEHIGGFLSDGGVHQLALLTAVLGNVAELNARTVQVRPESGDVDVVWSLLKLESGVVGSFNYGSAFGNKDKKGFFEILGDNGSIYYDFSPGTGNRIVLKTGGLKAGDEKSESLITIENEHWKINAELECLGDEINGKKGSVISWADVAYHHLAIVGAMLQSSTQNAATTAVTSP
ncbi:hypothetical protein DAMA08_010810 [Martiniozyma asiatica (nom. inval.)]|nr:hypothetical protein DAMA08_010810 [Martiniozyma asiatica]